MRDIFHIHAFYFMSSLVSSCFFTSIRVVWFLYLRISFWLYQRIIQARIIIPHRSLITFWTTLQKKGIWKIKKTWMAGMKRKWKEINLIWTGMTTHRSPRFFSVREPTRQQFSKLNVSMQYFFQCLFFLLAAAWVCPGRIALQSAKKRWQDTQWPLSQIDVHQAKKKRNKNMQSRPKNHPQKGPTTVEKIRAEGTGENLRV